MGVVETQGHHPAFFLVQPLPRRVKQMEKPIVKTPIIGEIRFRCDEHYVSEILNLCKSDIAPKPGERELCIRKTRTPRKPCTYNIGGQVIKNCAFMGTWTIAIKQVGKSRDEKSEQPKATPN